MQRIVTHLDGSPAGRANLEAACRLAAEVGAEVVAVYPVEVPDILPLDYPMGLAVTAASRECTRARIVGEEFGVTVDPAVCQAYSDVDAVVGVADRERADSIGLAAPRGLLGWLRWLFGPGPEIVRKSPRPVLLVGDGWRPQATENSVGMPSRHVGRTREDA